MVTGRVVVARSTPTSRGGVVEQGGALNSRLPLGCLSATSRLPLGYVSAISDVVKEGDVDATRSHVRHHQHPSLALFLSINALINYEFASITASTRAVPARNLPRAILRAAGSSVP